MAISPLLVWPTIALGLSVTNIFNAARPPWPGLNYILTAQRNIDASRARVPEGAKPRRIEFRHLTFAYPTVISGAGLECASKPQRSGPHPVLHDINLKIPAGSTLAIVGPTGSGKTTLAASRRAPLEAPDDSVLIDGPPDREWPLTTLRQSIGFGAQDSDICSAETSSRHIAFGLPAYEKQRVREAAELPAWTVTRGLRQGIRNMVGSRGITPPVDRSSGPQFARSDPRSADPDPG